MKWAERYLTLYGRDPQEVDSAIFDEIEEKFRKESSDRPLISLVLIAHNEERTILSSVLSLLDNQSRYPFELIVVDNASTDSTPHLLKRSGINFYQESKKGPGNARNCGLKVAKGDYLLSLDSDTIYPPRYVEIMGEHLMRSGVVAVYGLYSFIPTKEYPRFKLRLYELLRDIHLYLLHFKSPERVVRGSVFGHDTLLGKQLKYNSDIRRGEDGFLAYQLKEFGKLRMVRVREARPLTSTDPFEGDSLFGAFFKRFKQAAKGARKYFRKTKGEIEHQESNLL